MRPRSQCEVGRKEGYWSAEQMDICSHWNYSRTPTRGFYQMQIECKIFDEQIYICTWPHFDLGTLNKVYLLGILILARNLSTNQLRAINYYPYITVFPSTHTAHLLGSNEASHL